ncbi:hypothetical protein SCUP234_10165 [Seiridium cupressi]
MTSFSLSTIRIDALAAEAALSINGTHYVLSRLGVKGSNPLFREVAVKQLLEDWLRSQALLQSLADKINENATTFSHATVTNATEDTPIRFPDKLLVVRANYISYH